MAKKKMAPSGSDAVGGNTSPTASKKRISAGKHWVLTWQNYPSEWKSILEPKLFELEIDYIIGEEICPTTGTPHLQGFISFQEKARPIECLRWPKEIHFESMSKRKEEETQKNFNIAYCAKDNKYICSKKYIPQRKLIVEKPYGWQLDVIKIIEEIPDDRTIHWYWEDTGKIGKSTLTKWICQKYHAIVVSGKGSDMKHGVAKMVTEGRAPHIVLVDIPRVSSDHISYAGIEEIKNGCFFSPKYDSGMSIFPSPHVIVFANIPPNLSQMSEDRWHITNLRDH